MKYRVNNLIYAAEKDLHNTIRKIFEMTEPVNGDMLRGAACRYPLSVFLVCTAQYPIFTRNVSCR